MKATGTFDIALQPQQVSISASRANKFGRIAFDKTYTGMLKGTSRGEMLSAMASEQGSAGYVAIEAVKGELNGRSGSFVLQHYGTKTAGESFLLLEVLPDSATGELTGMQGKMSITIDNGQHFYELEYTLP